VTRCALKGQDVIGLPSVNVEESGRAAPELSDQGFVEGLGVRLSSSREGGSQASGRTVGPRLESRGVSELTRSTNVRKYDQPRAEFLQIEDLYDATLSNAFMLCQDSNVLLKNGSVGRARALAVLALEECGKAIMIHEAKVASFALELLDPVLDAAFWREWRTHLPKLRHVREFLTKNEYWFDVGPPEPNDFVLGSVDAYLAGLDGFAAEGDTSKMKGLYVNVDPPPGKSSPQQTTRQQKTLPSSCEWRIRSAGR
jgi:AbiV family abortive infection protein